MSKISGLNTDYRGRIVSHGKVTDELINLMHDEPDFVEYFSWTDAERDMRKYFDKVDIKHLIHLQSLLRAGQIDGKSSYAFAECGCFIATVGEFMVEELPKDEQTIHGWEMFEIFHEDGTIWNNSPFQQWLFLVNEGDTPQNNTIAKKFDTLLTVMIAEKRSLVNLGL